MLLSYGCNIDDKIIKHSIESGKNFEALLMLNFENPDMLHVTSIVDTNSQSFLPI